MLNFGVIGQSCIKNLKLGMVKRERDCDDNLSDTADSKQICRRKTSMETTFVRWDSHIEKRFLVEISRARNRQSVYSRCDDWYGAWEKMVENLKEVEPDSFPPCVTMEDLLSKARYLKGQTHLDFVSRVPPNEELEKLIYYAFYDFELPTPDLDPQPSQKRKKLMTASFGTASVGTASVRTASTMVAADIMSVHSDVIDRHAANFSSFELNLLKTCAHIDRHATVREYHQRSHPSFIRFLKNQIDWALTTIGFANSDDGSPTLILSHVSDSQ